MSDKPEGQWQIDTNDRYQKVVSTIITLATSALVLPTLFLKQFLSIPAQEPLINRLNGFTYAYWGFLFLSILFGLIFYYGSAKWVKSAWGKTTAISQTKIERILDWSFWLMVITLFIGILFLFAYITTYKTTANNQIHWTANSHGGDINCGCRCQ